VPVFRYTAYDGAGRSKQGTLEASSQAGAVFQLEGRGLVVVSIAQERATKKKRLRRLSLEGHVFFCKSLASYLKGGLTLTDALKLLSRQSPDRAVAAVYGELLESVQAGRKVSAGMRDLGVFREGLVGIVESGENGGALPTVLDKAASLYRLELSLRRKVRGALTYPLVMLLVGGAVVTFLLSYVVPKMTALFAEIGQTLPLPTRILLAISGFAREWFLPLALAGALLGFLFRRRLARIPVPFLRGLQERIALSLVFSHLATLCDAGIPLVQGLQLAASMDRNSERWRTVADLVKGGLRFAAALEKSGAFAEEVVYMVRVGEMGGELAEALRRTGENAWEIAEEQMERLTNLLEPIMVVVMGGMVGFVVVAVLLPIFDISTFVK
jgi:type II secretory pathway component PulF